MLPPPAPVVVISRDYGGVMVDFAARVAQYKGRKVRVRIEGECASACTLVLALPPDRVCVGPNAALEFHQSYMPNRFDPLDTSIRSEPGTAYMMQSYPPRVRDWIAGKGGLTADLITLQGDELRRAVRPCR